MADTGHRRLAAELNRGAPRQGVEPFALAQAVVVSTTNAAQASGGAAMCTVSWQGEEFPATYPFDYTPVIGHLVYVFVQPPQLLAIAHRLKLAP